MDLSTYVISNIFWAHNTNMPQMAEEIHNAAVVVPRAVMSSITVSGVLGFSTALIITFTTPSFEDVLNSDSKYPFMEVLIKTLSSNGAAAFLVACIIALAQASTTASLAVASRLLWSFSRDRGVPFWQWLRVVRQLPTLLLPIPPPDPLAKLSQANRAGQPLHHYPPPRRHRQHSHLLPPLPHRPRFL